MNGSRKRLLVTLWAVTGVMMLMVVASVLWAKYRARELPVVFSAPDFSLTDQDAHAFAAKDLHGKVWIADFVFTSCAGICPMMTQHMAEVQKQTNASAVQLVSFSVDPERDTPAVLKEYAASYKADESRWHFLTGTRAAVWEVSRGMKLAVGPDKGDQVMHSSHFLLVDGDGNVRGIYDGDKPDVVQTLAADAISLLR